MFGWVLSASLLNQIWYWKLQLKYEIWSSSVRIQISTFTIVSVTSRRRDIKITVVSVSPRAEKFNMISNNHGWTQAKVRFCVLDLKYPFCAHLVQKIKIVSLTWSLVLRLIRICRIQWWCSLFPFSYGKYTFLANLVLK